MTRSVVNRSVFSSDGHFLTYFIIFLSRSWSKNDIFSLVFCISFDKWKLHQDFRKQNCFVTIFILSEFLWEKRVLLLEKKFVWISEVQFTFAKFSEAYSPSISVWVKQKHSWASHSFMINSLNTKCFILECAMKECRQDAKGR